MAPVELVIFHYHLQPGEITEAIVQSLSAINDIRGIRRVRVVTGHTNVLPAVAERLAATGTELVVLPEIAPSAKPAPETHHAVPAGDSAMLARRLAAELGGEHAIWWVHNYHVGANATFTHALLAVAREGRQRMLLQIHDFPECGRYDNRARLHHTAGASLYPLTPNVHYAVDGERDARILTEAGIPARRVHLLVNPAGRTPATLWTDTREARITLRRELARRAPAALSKIDPERPLLLYPARATARKNVLEAGLLTRLHGRLSLVVTHPGDPSAERAYADLVTQAFSDGSIRGAYCTGATAAEGGVELMEMVRASDLIVWPSVKERSGRMLTTVRAWRRPLLARYLDVFEEITPVLEGYPHRFYISVRVPFSSPSLTDFRVYLKMRYGEQIGRLESIIPDQTIERLYDELDRMLEADSVCYSFLTPHMQYTLLRDLTEPTYRQLLRALNGELLGWIDELLMARCQDYGGRVIDAGGTAYARALGAALTAMEEPPAGAGADAVPGGTDPRGPAGNSAAAVHAAVTDRFAHLDCLRLLYAPADREMHG